MEAWEGSLKPLKKREESYSGELLFPLDVKVRLLCEGSGVWKHGKFEIVEEAKRRRAEEIARAGRNCTQTTHRETSQ